VTVQLPDPATEDCRALSSILARVGDKWTVLIVVLLGDGPKRFNEIRRMVGGISQRMLTFTLRGLERDGLVTRPRQHGRRGDRRRAGRRTLRDRRGSLAAFERMHDMDDRQKETYGWSSVRRS
jgi:DNA-binding transcriptional ArsR family regulator